MAVVKVIHSGGATIRILDDVCKNTTKEDFENAMKRVAEIAYPALLAQHNRELEKQKTKEN